MIKGKEITNLIKHQEKRETEEAERKRKEAKIKTLSDLCSEIRSQKNIIGFKFIEKLTEKFPQFEKDLKGLRGAINNVASCDMSLLNKYYKTEENESGSVKLIMNSDFKKIINSTADCQLKRNLLLQEKVKKEYLMPKHLNFFSAEFDVITNKIKVNGYSKTEIESKIELAITKYCCNAYGAISRNFVGWNIHEEGNKRQIMLALRDVITDSAIYKGIMNAGTTGDKMPIIRYNLTLNDRTLTEEQKLIKSTEIDRNGEKSISSLVNGTFDHSERIFKLLNENTKSAQSFTTNPHTGLQSVKNIRVAKEDTKLNNFEVSEIIRKVTEINKFFEDAGYAIKTIESLAEKQNETSIKLVSGNEILTYYNVSSYKDNEYKNSIGSGTAKRNCPTGTLFNSCMRMPEIKPRLEFYAKNTDYVKLLVCTTENGKYITARAITWFEKETGIHYVDRIFAIDDTNAIKLINYINKTENTFSVAQSNKIFPLAPGKRKDTFLIKFNGSVPTKSCLPYFDTMCSIIFFKDDELYIGRCNDYEQYVPSEPKQGVIYATELSVQNTRAICLEKLKNITRKTCPICGEILGSRICNFDGIQICGRHIAKATNGKSLIQFNGGMAFLEKKEEDKDEYVKNTLCGNGIGVKISQEKDTKSIRITTNRRDMLRYLTTINYSIQSYSQYKYSPISSDELKSKLQKYAETETTERSKIFYKSKFNSLNEDLRYNKSDRELSRYEVIYDKNELIEFQFCDKKILIPKIINQEEKEYIMELVKAEIISTELKGEQSFQLSESNKIEELYKKIGPRVINLKTGETAEETEEAINEAKDWLHYSPEPVYTPFYQQRIMEVTECGQKKRMEYFEMYTKNFRIQIPVRYLLVEKTIQDRLDEIEKELNKLTNAR